MQRDFLGYSRSIPHAAWPNSARIALSFVVNYEEGAESNILDGDEASEFYLSDLPSAQPWKEERNFSMESLYEYGSRAGVWRLLRIFDEFEAPLTIFATGLALERNPPLIDTLKHSRHEIAGHGYRWIDYRSVDEATEREHIQKTIETIQERCQKKVSGWYTGRRSANTRKLVVEAGLRYDSDGYADDLPYWVEVGNKPHLIIPYQLDANDFRYCLSPGWSSGEDFFHYLKAAFDCLYREGGQFPKMMSVGLHPRLSGRPGRSEWVYRFLQYVKTFDHVWICRREEIADIWYNKDGSHGAV